MKIVGIGWVFFCATHEDFPGICFRPSVKPLAGLCEVRCSITPATQLKCLMDKVAPIFLTLFILCVSGRSTVVEAKRHKNVRLESLKTAYLVRDPDSTRGCEEATREALTQRGVVVTYGAFQAKPKDVDFYVEVVDRWRWDVTMFLVSLEIRFRENTTGELIATGWFKQGEGTFFHTFPDQRKTTFQVIDSIYNGQAAPKQAQEHP
jgi:hypothetical protein